jgi:hypothetical protein
MTIADIIQLSRDITNTSESMTGCSDIQILRLLNIVYHKIEDRIISEIDEWFFIDSYSINTIANQSRYELIWSTWVQAWFKKIKEISIKWNSSQQFYESIKQKRAENEDWSDDYQKVNGDKCYDIIWEKIDIYPSPIESVGWWLLVKVILNLPDLVEWWAEETIFPWHSQLRNRHHLLSLWVAPYIYRMKWQTNEKNDSINEFEKEMREFIHSIKYRNNESQIQEEQFYQHLTN